jgi:glycosyltransferase involved in cell wall biosynthesis
MSDTSFPRVSVVTATYNGARFLPAAIESILAQSYTDFEYVIVDDASTDASAAIATDYAAQDNRVRLVTNPVRLGPPGALNRALAAVQGDYVAVLDHDDLALPERLARQVAFLDAQPAVGAVGAKVRFIDEAGASYPASKPIRRIPRWRAGSCFLAPACSTPPRCIGAACSSSLAAIQRNTLICATTNCWGGWPRSARS